MCLVIGTALKIIGTTLKIIGTFRSPRKNYRNHASSYRNIISLPVENGPSGRIRVREGMKPAQIVNFSMMRFLDGYTLMRARLFKSVLWL